LKDRTAGVIALDSIKVNWSTVSLLLQKLENRAILNEYSYGKRLDCPARVGIR
jgi:hypothetical protein